MQALSDTMKEDTIQEIGIDAEERLYVKLSSSKFPMMYREAIGVHTLIGSNK